MAHAQVRVEEHVRLVIITTRSFHGIEKENGRSSQGWHVDIGTAGIVVHTWKECGTADLGAFQVNETGRQTTPTFEVINGPCAGEIAAPARSGQFASFPESLRVDP